MPATAQARAMVEIGDDGPVDGTVCWLWRCAVVLCRQQAAHLRAAVPRARAARPPASPRPIRAGNRLVVGGAWDQPARRLHDDVIHEALPVAQHDGADRLGRELEVSLRAGGVGERRGVRGAESAPVRRPQRCRHWRSRARRARLERRRGGASLRQGWWGARPARARRHPSHPP
eukprot:scaffold211165_cov30-Tisochrysis_lutea.AAC.5